MSDAASTVDATAKRRFISVTDCCASEQPNEDRDEWLVVTTIRAANEDEILKLWKGSDRHASDKRMPSRWKNQKDEALKLAFMQRIEENLPDCRADIFLHAIPYPLLKDAEETLCGILGLPLIRIAGFPDATFVGYVVYGTPDESFVIIGPYAHYDANGRFVALLPRQRLTNRKLGPGLLWMAYSLKNLYRIALEQVIPDERKMIDWCLYCDKLPSGAKAQEGLDALHRILQVSDITRLEIKFNPKKLKELDELIVDNIAGIAHHGIRYPDSTIGKRWLSLLNSDQLADRFHSTICSSIDQIV